MSRSDDKDRVVVRRRDGVTQIVSFRLPVRPMHAATSPPATPRVVFVNLTGSEKLAMFCWGVIAMGLFVIAVGAIWLATHG